MICKVYRIIGGILYGRLGGNYMSKKIYFVIPCYNESEVLYETSKRLNIKVTSLIDKGLITEESRIVFVDDGSKDNTWGIIRELTKSNCLFSGIKLSRNRGHQNALLAGLMTVKDLCDAVISLDADLQDDIDIIDQFIEKFVNESCDVVYGVRNDRTTDTRFKRYTAQLFYKFMSVLGVKTVYNHADFRLMSSRALNELSKYKERNLFLRGIVPLIGYDTSIVKYERKERIAGESKYPLKKMLSFALDGITSFSTKPLTIIAGLGSIIIISSIFAAIYVFCSYLVGHVVAGWTSLMLSIWFIGGVQLLCVGVLGTYTGKIYKEVKERPRYHVESFLSNENYSYDEENKYYGENY